MAQKIKKTLKSSKTNSSPKKTAAKPVAKKTSRKSAVDNKESTATSKKRTSRPVKIKAPKSKKSIHKEIVDMGVELKKSSSKVKKAATVPGLLRQTKTTNAALNHLGKGIELIHRKDYKKARLELNKLLQSYSEETEILVRAKSYILICERESAAQKQPESGTGQLYTFGIMEHNKANYDAAISYFKQSLKNHPEADYIYYSIAASLALKGDLPESMENLKKAIDLNADSRIYAKNDEDFSVFEKDEIFEELVGILPNPENDQQ